MFTSTGKKDYRVREKDNFPGIKEIKNSSKIVGKRGILNHDCRQGSVHVGGNLQSGGGGVVVTND